MDQCQLTSHNQIWQTSMQLINRQLMEEVLACHRLAVLQECHQAEVCHQVVKVDISAHLHMFQLEGLLLTCHQQEECLLNNLWRHLLCLKSSHNSSIQTLEWECQLCHRKILPLVRSTTFRLELTP